MPKKITTLLIILLFVGALILAKIIFYRDDATKAPEVPGKGAAGGKPLATRVAGFIVQPTVLDNKIVATGTVLANDEVEIRSEISGKIVHIYFKEGSHIAKGALLVKINDADLQAQLKKQQYQKQLAEDKVNREKQLLQSEAVSQEEYDTTVNQLNTINADIELLRAQIDKTEIKAPFGGVIGLKSVSEGSYISPTVKIASIQAIDPVKIDFSIPEKYMNVVRKGDPISFTVSGSNTQYPGNIYAIEPKVDLSTRTIQIRALCPNKTGAILPGAFAHIEVVLNRINEALMIPTEAVIPELKGQKVFVSRDGKAVSQKVETGIRTDTQIQITQGLSSGDTIITTGIMQLKPGMPVQVSNVKQ